MNSKWVVLSCLFVASACNAKNDRAARTYDSRDAVPAGETTAFPSTMAPIDNPAAIDASTPLVVQLGRDFQVISFNKGSFALSDTEKANLRTLIENAKSKGEIDRIHVVAWSDKVFPAGKTLADLSKVDQDLAKNRATQIDDYLSKSLNVSGVKTFNMAQKSNWFARAFNTEDAELKSMFGQKGADAIDLKMEEFKVVKDNGGPMKSVILIQMKAVAASSTLSK